MAGFYEFVTGLQAPISGILRAQWSIVSGGLLENSRFWETLVGDRVRSADLDADRSPSPTPNNSLARRPAGIWRHPRRPRTGPATRMPRWQAIQRSRSAPSGLAAKAFDGG